MNIRNGNNPWCLIGILDTRKAYICAGNGIYGFTLLVSEEYGDIYGL
jgi:hypothetical protein